MHRITVKEVEEIAFLIAQKKLSFNEPIPAFFDEITQYWKVV